MIIPLVIHLKIKNTNDKIIYNIIQKECAWERNSLNQNIREKYIYLQFSKMDHSISGITP